MLLRILLTMLAVMAAFLSSTAEGAPTCTISVIPDEAAMRTRGSVRVRIEGGNLLSVAQADAASMLNLRSASGRVIAQSVAFVVDLSPHFIIINLNTTVSNYDIWEDDAVTFDIPQAFFQEAAGGCPGMSFAISPSPGVIDVAHVPIVITEVEINTAGIEFQLNVSHEQFLNADLNWTVSSMEPGLAIQFSLASPPPSSVLIVRIPQNDTFNILRYDSITLEISIPASMTRSHRAPEFDYDQKTSITIPIEGSRPFILAEYKDGQSGIPAEQIWDGTATVTLRLLGDVFLPDMMDHWNDLVNGPKFEVSRPVQPNGFELFLRSGLRPVAVINSRAMVLTFPARTGFALTTPPVENVDISNLEVMIAEQMDPVCTGGCAEDNCFCANFRILKANTTSIRVSYSSPVFYNNKTENYVRQEGITILVDLRYDIFSTSGTSMNNIRRTFTKNQFLSLDQLIYSLSEYSTRLNITIPPQVGYNIAEGTPDVITLTFEKAMSATQTVMPESVAKRSFQILPVTTPICRMPVYELTEADVRERDMYVNISVTGDEFCFDPPPTGNPLTSPTIAAFLSSIKTTFGGVKFQLADYSATSLRIRFVSNATYDISRTDIVVIPVPNTIMCSLEYCQADPAPLAPEPSYSLTIPIRHVAGTIEANFPQLDEKVMRTDNLKVDIRLKGETFATSIFFPSWTIDTKDWTRGFATSTRAYCRGERYSSNLAMASVTCFANSSYDVSALETVTIGVEASSVAGGIAPKSTGVVPLRVTPVVGNVTATADGFVAGPEGLVLTVDEADIIRGGTRVRIRLGYERFNVRNLTTALVSSVKVISETKDALGVTGSAASIFARTGFQFNGLQEDDLLLTFQPAPAYDIMVPESFTFSVSGGAVASGMEPTSNTITVHVLPSNGSFEVYGTAKYASARQVLEQQLTLSIRLHNDVWLRNADFVVKDLCPLEKLAVDGVPSCVVYVDDANRVLTILFQPSDTFSLYTNTTYTLPINSWYIRSGTIPPEPVELFIYVSAGRISWSGPSVVTEDTVRTGGMPVIQLKVGGDALADVRAVRASLVASVTCSGSNDRYGFCGRADYLFGDKLTLVGDTRRTLNIVLQSNEDFDVYETQNVTLRLSGEGLVSRKDPHSNESFTFQIIPTTGKFFISGFTDSITERDISGVTLKTLQMVLTLYGERWLTNKTKIIPLLLAGMTSDAAAHESNGFLRYKSQIITADGASLSESGRVMTLQFTAAPAYDIYYDERVIIKIGGDCVLSNMNPALSSSSNAFTIQATGGLITLSPTTITADVLRTLGVLLTLSIDGDQWKTEVVQNPTSLLEAIRVGSSPQQEPSGFAVNLDTAAEDIRTRGSSINGTSLIITLMPMPNYNIINEETITLFLVQGWTTSGLPLVPNEFPLLVTPVYDMIEVVLSMEPYLVKDAKGRYTNETTFDIDAWVAAVASLLSVTPSAIVVDYNGDEYMLPPEADARLYRRIQFRVRVEEAGNTAPFDNRAASNFISYSPSFLQSKFSIIRTFFNGSAPPESFWLSLRPAVKVDEAFFIPINKNIIWAFAAIIVVVIAAVGTYLYVRTRKMLGGVSRAKEVDKSIERKAALAELDADEDKKFDLGIYSGQVSGGRAGEQRIDNEVSGSYLGDPVEMSPRGRVPAEGGENRGYAYEYELPMDLYSGQSPTGRAWEDNRPQAAPAEREAPPLPYADLDDDASLRAVYPPHTRPSQMFMANRRKRDFDDL